MAYWHKIYLGKDEKSAVNRREKKFNSIIRDLSFFKRIQIKVWIESISMQIRNTSKSFVTSLRQVKTLNVTTSSILMTLLKFLASFSNVIFFNDFVKFNVSFYVALRRSIFSKSLCYQITRKFVEFPYFCHFITSSN